MKKFVKTFESFYQNDSVISSNEYLEIIQKTNGLEIILTPEGKEYLDDYLDELQTEMPFFDLFETINTNSELIFHMNLGDAGFGLTSAPGITDGYFYGDNGDLEESSEDAELYFYEPYQIKSFLEELYEKGKTFFQKALN